MSRDLGGMGNIDLYRHSYIGTKRLIERYVESAMRTVDARDRRPERTRYPTAWSTRIFSEGYALTPGRASGEARFS